jgi:hypothetical protein
VITMIPSPARGVVRMLYCERTTTCTHHARIVTVTRSEEKGQSAAVVRIATPCSAANVGLHGVEAQIRAACECVLAVSVRKCG